MDIWTWMSSLLSALFDLFDRYMLEKGITPRTTPREGSHTITQLPGLPDPPFETPTTWTGHGKPPGPCRCTTELALRASVAGMDPLIADAFHNLTCSPLCRMPEELLLVVMKQLDPLSIQCLRRACRLFVRLYSSPELSKGHDVKYAKTSQSFVPWYEPKRDSYDKRLLARLVDKDTRAYCTDCRVARASSSWGEKIARLTTEFMHCSGCRVDHPVCLFSAAQRKVVAKLRICIGRQGFVRVCDHRVVRWADVASHAQVLARLDTGARRNNAVVSLGSCDHHSHRPKHHAAGAPQILHDQVRPSISVTGNSREFVAVELRWLGHLSLPEPGRDESGEKKRFVPRAIRRQLEELRRGAGEFLAPELAPGRLTEMNCFDPNRCCCLEYAGANKLAHRWQLTPHEEIHHPTCCLDHRRKLRPLRPLHNGTDEDPQAQERTGGHHARVPTLGTYRTGNNTIHVEIDSCADGSRCLRVDYRRSIHVVSRNRRLDPMTMAWYQALDPDSYKATEDGESFGILWCRQQGCMNYYRYLRKAFVSVDDMHRGCKEPCPVA